MCKLAIDIGSSYAHIAISAEDKIFALPDREMAVCVLPDGHIIWGNEAKRYAQDEDAEYVRGPFDVMNAQESLNGRSYQDVFADFFSSVYGSLCHQFGVVSLVTIITPQNLSPLDEQFRILEGSAKQVFMGAVVKLTSVGFAAAKQYRVQSKHSGKEDILVVDFGTYHSTLHLVRYNENNECVGIFSGAKTMGANYVLELMYQSLYEQVNISNAPTEVDWENLRKATITLSEQQTTSICVQQQSVPYSRTQLAVNYEPCIAMMVNNAKQLIDQHKAEIQTIVLLGGNFKSPIPRQSLSNQLYVLLKTPIQLYTTDWHYSRSAAVGILQSNEVPIANVACNGRTFPLKVGDNFFDTPQCSKHFKIQVVQHGKNYIYNIFAENGSVNLTTMVLDKHFTWLPNCFQLNETVHDWHAGQLRFELKV